MVTCISVLSLCNCLFPLLQGTVTYQLPSASLSWSSVFHQLESNKERLGIIDYSVSQTTLDQVTTSEELHWCASVIVLNFGASVSTCTY